MGAATFAALREQAALQLHHRRTDSHRCVLLGHQPDRGLALLPEPDPGDVFFDMEGDPYVEDGLEYLFGCVFAHDGNWRFEARWGHSRATEKLAFERFVDFVAGRRKTFPGMHVYHYAPYETAAMKRLACLHGTREEQIDDFLRQGVFVDLYRVVRQGLRISQPSYSIKKLEVFYMAARQADVKDAGGSIVAYEDWLETREQRLLDDIEHYNAEDCYSTQMLRDWLLERRSELEARLGEPIPWFTVPRKPEAEDREAVVAEHEELMAALRAGTADTGLAEAEFPAADGLPEPELESELEPGPEPEPDSPNFARHLMADLLGYHRREAKPVWWAFFDRLAMEPDEFLEDADCLGGLKPDGDAPVGMAGKSAVWRFTFPPQEHRLRKGADPYDPATGASAGEIVDLDSEAGWLELKRGPRKHAGVALPRALMPGGPLQTGVQRKALRRLALAVVEHGFGETGPYRALRDILVRALPRFAGRPAGEPLQDGGVTPEEAIALAHGLQDSHLFIQGPPGAGKTFVGAKIIVDLLKQGFRVGVAALSHKAVHNLLAEVEDEAVRREVAFRGVKKVTAGNEESAFRSNHGPRFFANETDNAACIGGSYNLVAGTSWLFSREEFDGGLDYLVIDEAGQISLADALAMGTSARNLVLLGDPRQLPQVMQGVHPGVSGRSVLEHLLGDHVTIPPTRGLFLQDTWRMHPKIAAFISEISYECRLKSAKDLGREALMQEADDLAGLWFLPVEHEGRSQASPEEAARVAATIERLVGAAYTNRKGETRVLAQSDILVVAPYNLQVHTLREALPAAVRVGTVDKFQGQEAPVVLFSMATSSGSELPRNLEFLFSRNRLNVAISRARCLAALVASPRLLDVPCRTLEQMRLVNALCRFVELARPGEQWI